MVIKAWSVTEKSYRYNDYDGETETLFTTEELRDIYFERIKTQYQNNENCSIEYYGDGFEVDIKGNKWSYSIYCRIKEINIIESLD